MLTTQFLVQGIRRWKSLRFLKSAPKEYSARANSFGLDLETPQGDGKVEILYLVPWIFPSTRRFRRYSTRCKT